MKIEQTERGFDVLDHDAYPPGTSMPTRLAQQSSVVGDYDDAMTRPGSSALWIGVSHHLNREQVAQFVAHLTHWLETGSLALPSEVRDDA